jgi:hypothetical protein
MPSHYSADYPSFWHPIFPCIQAIMSSGWKLRGVWGERTNLGASKFLSQIRTSDATRKAIMPPDWLLLYHNALQGECLLSPTTSHDNIKIGIVYRHVPGER